MANFFKRLFRKESRTSRLMVTRGLGGQKWTDRRFEAFAREAYMKNVIAFRCIFEISTSVAAADWDLFEVDSKGEREQLTEHWVLDLIERPNPQQSMNFLITRAISFLVLSGNSFIERVVLDSGPNKGVVKELYVLRPDRMKLLLSQGRLVGYGFSPTGGASVDWEVDPVTGQSDILHLCHFHPLDDLLGLSIVDPTAREIDTSNEAIQWNKSLLENQARPGLLITLVGNVSDEQFDQVERQLDDRSGGSGAGKNLIIEGEKGTQVKPYNWSPAEMDWLEGNREWARRICFGFGVPPMLLGIPGDNTYSNQREARQGFWDTTVLFYLKYLRGEFNNWLLPKGEDLFLNYNLDDIPAMEYRRERKWERAQKADFLSINEKRELAGYESWGEAGDVILVPATMIPLELQGVKEEEGGEGGEEELTEEEEQKRQELLALGWTEEEVDEFFEEPRRLPGPGGKGMVKKKKRGNGNGRSAKKV